MKVRENCYVLNNVASNTDCYGWKELNCMYKPFAIALKSIEQDFFDMFLYFFSNHLIYVMETDRFLYNKNHILFDYYNNELKDIFSARIKLNTCQDRSELLINIEHEIKKDRVVICPVDLYELPFSKIYMENHQRHFTIIKGFDGRKQIFYILDTVHMELGASTIYTDFMIEYERMYKLVKSFIDNFDDCRGVYFWSLEKEEDDNIARKDYINKSILYMVKHNENLLDINNYKCIELDIVKNMKLGCFEDNIIEDIRLMNMRSVYYGSLISFCETVKFKDMPGIIDRCEKLKQDWTRIKKLIIYKIQKEDMNVLKLEQYIMKAMEDDKEMMSFINNKTKCI